MLDLVPRRLLNFDNLLEGAKSRQRLLKIVDKMLIPKLLFAQEHQNCLLQGWMRRICDRFKLLNNKMTGLESRQPGNVEKFVFSYS